MAFELLNLNNCSDESANNSTYNNNNDDNDFFSQLKTTSRQTLKLIELDEVIYYLALDSIELDEDPIK
ncbi:4160_t:CDS:1, partial [Racocetra persica]